MACSCGFSRNFPVCDGTHKVVREVKTSIVIKLLDDLKTCPDVIENDNNIYCINYKEHSVCKKINDILFMITNKKIYLIPNE